MTDSVTSNAGGTWIQKGFGLLFAVFCLELGVFLLFYPWTDQWMQSAIPAFIPPLRPIWLNGYFKGAMSGVGLLNLWIALSDVVRMRSAEKPPSPTA